MYLLIHRLMVGVHNSCFFLNSNNFENLTGSLYVLGQLLAEPFEDEARLNVI
jgi:hypothetical protein